MIYEGGKVEKLIENHNTIIEEVKLKLNPYSNMLLVKKKIGFNR